MPKRGAIFMLEELVKIAKVWFEENDKKCPIYAKDWINVGVSVPPKMGRAALKSKGYKPADIINEIYGTNVAQTNSRIEIDYDDIGLEFIQKVRGDKNHYNVTYRCICCDKQYTTDYGTIVRMVSRKDKYCYNCRGVGGTFKELEYYEDIVPENYILLSRENKHINIKHIVCGTEFRRSISGIKYRETAEICCPTCDSSILFGKQVGEYASMIEKELTEYMMEISPVNIQTQVLYSKFMNTDRKFRADIYVPEFNTIIEITSYKNSLGKYEDRMKEKRDLAESTGVKFYKATCKQQIEDIVRTFRENLKN